MKNLQMPHSYISVSEEELRSISGGGPLGDALDLFFSNLRLDDLFFSGGLISLSFTFVPMLLFNVVKTGFNFVVSAYVKRLEAKIVEGPYIHHCVGIHENVVPVL